MLSEKYIKLANHVFLRALLMPHHKAVKHTRKKTLTVVVRMHELLTSLRLTKREVVCLSTEMITRFETGSGRSQAQRNSALLASPG